jgi:pimeloyl-ACP methyl ester carboxylesterase
MLNNHDTAVNVPTQFVTVGEHKLAYRRIGNGHPIVLCLRLRGVMDVWDPAFLDSLARDFTVITFDYAGLGQSTGTPTYDRAAMANDAKDLVDALKLEKVVIAGWSLGGIAAQIFAARYPERTSHAILIGTVPPGKQPYQRH